MANERPPMRMMGRGGPPPHERMLMAEKPKNTKGTLKRLVGYIGKNRYLMILLLSVMLIITVLNLSLIHIWHLLRFERTFYKAVLHCRRTPLQS